MLNSIINIGYLIVVLGLLIIAAIASINQSYLEGIFYLIFSFILMYLYEHVHEV